MEYRDSDLWFMKIRMFQDFDRQKNLLIKYRFTLNLMQPSFCSNNKLSASPECGRLQLTSNTPLIIIFPSQIISQ